MSEATRAIDADPVASHASEFANTVDPLDGVDYTWLADVAKGRYDMMVKAFEDLDAKAAALVGYLGSGTGMISLGTLFTVVNSTVSPWTALAALPALVAAFIALMCATHARHTESVYLPPTVETLFPVANEFGKDVGRAKAVMAAEWDVCTALMRPVIARKGERVNHANWYFAWAVILLSLPVLVSIVRRLAGMTP